MVPCLEHPPGPERDAAVDRACRRHPESGAELRRRLQVLEELGVEDLGEAPFVVPTRLGEFELGERLGEGGMAVVHAAEQRSLGREVALKLLRPGELLFPGARERFRREVDALARLEHPGIVRILAVGDDEVPWFAMERLRGCSLAELVSALQGRAPESLRGADLEVVLGGAVAPELAGGSWMDLVLRIGIAVGQALAHAHQAGVLHRDVKPSNIVLTPDGRVVLLDFGLTTLSEPDALTRSGTRLGTLQYMSPQQLADARDVDARDDVYSLAMTLLELCALQAPFQAGDRLALERAILTGHSEVRANLRARNPKVPGDLAVVLRKATDVDRGSRYGSVEDLVDELERVAGGRSIVAQAPGMARRGWRWCRRHPGRAVGVVLAVWMFVGTPVLLWWLERDHAVDLVLANRELRGALGARDVELHRGDALAGLLRDTFRSNDPDDVGGAERTAAELFERALDRVDGVGEVRTRGELRSYLAEVLDDLGRPAAALDAARNALRDLDGLDRSEPGFERLRRARATALVVIATAENRAARYFAAREAAGEALALDVWPYGSPTRVRLGMLIASSRLRQGDQTQVDELRRLRNSLGPTADLDQRLEIDSVYASQLAFAAARAGADGPGLLAEIEAVAAAIEVEFDRLGEARPVQRGVLLATLGQGQRALQRFGDAQRSLEQARDLLSSALPGSDRRVLGTRTKLACVLFAIGELRRSLAETEAVLGLLGHAPPVGMHVQLLDNALSVASALREYRRMGPWLGAMARDPLAELVAPGKPRVMMAFRNAEYLVAESRFAAARDALAQAQRSLDDLPDSAVEDSLVLQMRARIPLAGVRLEWLAGERVRAAELARAVLRLDQGALAVRDLPWGPYADLALAAERLTPEQRVQQLDAAMAGRPGWLDHGGVWWARRQESWARVELQAAEWEAEMGVDPEPRRARVRAVLASSPARFDDLLALAEPR